MRRLININPYKEDMWQVHMRKLIACKAFVAFSQTISSYNDTLLE